MKVTIVIVIFQKRFMLIRFLPVTILAKDAKRVKPIITFDKSSVMKTNEIVNL